MTALTPRQAEVLESIARLMGKHQRPPSHREIGLAVGLRSPNGVIYHLRVLRRKGHIAYDPRTPRAIRLTQPAHCPFCGCTCKVQPS